MLYTVFFYLKWRGCRQKRFCCTFISTDNRLVTTNRNTLLFSHQTFSWFSIQYYSNVRKWHLSQLAICDISVFLINLCILNADSTWGQYFKNAELEKMLNQDLSRLYPELGDFFQTSACQSMLGRILLVWSLRYPEFGYRQGNALTLQSLWDFLLVKNVWYQWLMEDVYLQHGMPKQNHSIHCPYPLELAPRSCVHSFFTMEPLWATKISLLK